MTKEEYNIKIKELRKERDSYTDKAQELSKKMDELVKQLNIENIDWAKGKFVKIDRRSKGGYLSFFHVATFEPRPRGYVLYGKGFSISNFVIRIDESYTLYVEDGDLNILTEIKEEEFYKAFDIYIDIMKAKLKDYQSYRTLGNLFDLKFEIANKPIELIELDDEILNKLNE